MVSSVIDLLLRTLFNIDAATVVTLSVKVTLLFLQWCVVLAATRDYSATRDNSSQQLQLW